MQTNENNPEQWKMPNLSQAQVDEICKSLGKTGSTVFVLYNVPRNAVAFDPATKKPAHWTNVKVAEKICSDIARQSGERHIVMTVTEALKSIIKNHYKKS